MSNCNCIGVFQINCLANINYVGFSPDDNVEDVLSNIISRAAKSIKIMIFKISSDAIVQSLIDARIRGIDVKIIVEDRNYKNDKKVMDLMQKNKISIQVCKKTSNEILHHKITLIDSTGIVLGTGNYVHEDFMSNHESILFIESRELNQTLAELFNSIWHNKCCKPNDKIIDISKFLFRFLKIINKPRVKVLILAVSLTINLFLLFQ